jgi:hypothetical protein
MLLLLYFFFQKVSCFYLDEKGLCVAEGQTYLRLDINLKGCFIYTALLKHT